jgi:SprT protein
MLDELTPCEVPYIKRAQPVVDPKLKERAKQSLVQWMKIAREEFGHSLRMPTISFDLTGTFAGYAYFSRWHIRLNHILLQENIEKFESSTLPHELAHLINRYLYGKKVKPHGPEWKAVMRRLGLEPERCHSYDVDNSRTTTKVYGYVCSCCQNGWLTSRQHKKERRGVLYFCNSCKGPMRFKGEAPAT